MKNLTRRKFAGLTAGAALAATGFPHIQAAGGKSGRKRIAMITTEVRKLSHGENFLDRFLEGFGWEGRHYHPRTEIVSLYVDQFPESDLSREREKRFGFKIYPTIAEALTLGTSKLAVDGVVVIGEHGKYPRNKRNQTLYPRYKFFQEIIKVFEASGRSVPIFNDKHLSTEWSECMEMVETAKRMGFAFMAGSSLPVTRRMPAIDFPLGAPLVESVAICYGGVDSYDFHGLETAQCMSERRRGGETGVKKVQALSGAFVWKRLEEDSQTQKLFLAALARSQTMRAPEGYTFAPPSLALAKQQCRDPIGYFYEHNDGLRTAMFLMNGLVTDFTYAGLRRDNNEIISTLMFLPMPSVISTVANFFNPLIHHIETMILNGRSPYPIERTLLTSGMTLFAVESRFREEAEIVTPEMAVSYQAPRESLYWRA